MEKGDLCATQNPKLMESLIVVTFLQRKILLLGGGGGARNVA